MAAAEVLHALRLSHQQVVQAKSDTLAALDGAATTVKDSITGKIDNKIVTRCHSAIDDATVTAKTTLAMAWDQAASEIQQEMRRVPPDPPVTDSSAG